MQVGLSAPELTVLKWLTSPVVTGRSEVRRLVLTASGGPFRGCTRADLAGVTAEQALAHPTWAMGPVVTVNSSTLVNKGLYRQSLLR